MEASERPLETSSEASDRRLVTRNALYLTAAQVLTMPVSMLINALNARYLGAAEFGYIYLAGTMCSFGFLVVEWGGQGVLPAAIARDRSQASALLGTSLAWRLVSAGIVYAVVAVGCHLFGYGRELQWALGLLFLMSAAISLAGALKDTIRGFERTDIPAFAQIGQQLLVLALLTPVLMLGGRMRASLAAQTIGYALTFAVLWPTLRLVGIRKLSFQRGVLKSLFSEGTPFVFFGLTLVLQPSIDAIYLSKLAPSEVMGWYAVSRRLLGVLIFPATVPLAALYPTLCRLFGTDSEGYKRMARGALHSVTLIVVPIALGTGLYPEIGIAIFSREAFAPAAQNLRIFAVYLLLMYISMPLGTCILAARKQRAWSVVQSLCLVVSLVLDPLLIPWFQRRTGNGGIGLCVAAVVSEVFVIACGVVLAPRGIFDRRFARSVLLAVLSGGAMALVAHLMKSINPFLAAPFAVAAYVGALIATGGIEKTQLAAARALISRKLSRR
jgi:O-antigen/teichoic acid export membrane protein